MSESPYEILSMLFSEEGFVHGAFSIKLNNNAKATICQNEEGFVLSFPEVQPEAIVKKVVHLNVKINGIIFKKDRGILQLHRFPDIPFMYDWVMGKPIGDMWDMDAIAKTREDVIGKISYKYSSEKDKKIAHNVLNLCEEWAIIKGTQNFSNMSEREARAACKAYIKENLEPVKMGFFMSLILSAVVKIIIEWIINNYIFNLRKNIGINK